MTDSPHKWISFPRYYGGGGDGIWFDVCTKCGIERLTRNNKDKDTECPKFGTNVERQQYNSSDS